ncbi:MAG: hybrid sensor histidine kinase/response regulator [Magnetococcus sp. DMHC-6]
MNESDQKAKILIVDDIPGNIKTLIAILGEAYDYFIALDGKQALEIATRKSVDLILLDVIMPGMDGYEVCKKLKEEKQTERIPIIFLTSKNEETDETKALEMGAVDFLSKPASPQVVKARVKTHLRLKSALETLEKKNQELFKAAQQREDVDRIMRHDLKSPLNAIISFSEILSTSLVMDASQEQMCKIVYDAGYTLLNMINLSLDLYKMERGNYVLDPKKVNIINIIDKVVYINSEFMQSKKIAIDVLLEGLVKESSDQLWIIGEELLCFSMLCNLIKNAIEASPRDERITISLVRREMVEVSIHNVGSVPEEIRETFFDKYVTFGKRYGTGLGTYSAKLMAHIQNGTIHLDISDVQGTTIIVRLPDIS